MHGAFGLSRDPFAGVWDGALFWETPERAAAREAATEALRGGRGVWLRGEAGAGRGVLVCRIAEDLVVGGTAVLLWDGPPPTTAEELLARLVDVSGTAVRDDDKLSLAETLYARLLAALPQAGWAVVAPATAPLPVDLLSEVQILADLRVAGSPVALPILCGEGDSPLEGLHEVRIDKPGPGDLREFLAQRAAACGRPDLLPPARLADVALRADGLGDAVARAGRELARLGFVGPGRLDVVSETASNVG